MKKKKRKQEDEFRSLQLIVYFDPRDSRDSAASGAFLPGGVMGRPTGCPRR